MNINTAVCPLLLLKIMMMMTVMEIMISFLSIHFFVHWMYFWPVTPKICVNMSMFYIDSSWVGSGLGLYSMQQQCTMSKLSPQYYNQNYSFHWGGLSMWYWGETHWYFQWFFLAWQSGWTGLATWILLSCSTKKQFISFVDFRTLKNTEIQKL